MNYYQKEFFPKLTEVFLNNKIFNKERKNILSKVSGNVLEVGFGSGLNLNFYPKTVDSLVAIDPSKTALSLSEKRKAIAKFPINLLCGTCESASLSPESFDYIVTTWVLCMVEDPESTLRCMRKLLKPNGKYLFLEHGYSNNKFTRKMQNYWNPFHNRLFGGCNINRPIDTLVENAGFKILELKRFNLFGIGLVFSTYQGSATC